MNKIHILLTYFLLVTSPQTNQWGFDAHKFIAQHAVYRLPDPLFGLYKRKINEIIEWSVKPDKRRYIRDSEGPRHYIDLDKYPDSLYVNNYKNWNQVQISFHREFLSEHGTLPWNLLLYKNLLTTAFKKRDWNEVIKLSAEISHYAADAQVPLHTISNYNGDDTGQDGIHALWETRVPGLFIGKMTPTFTPSKYIPKVEDRIWKDILKAHSLADDVLKHEYLLSLILPDRKYSFEKGKRIISMEYANSYHKILGTMVENQLDSSIRLTADLWYSCWVDAGMPAIPED